MLVLEGQALGAVSHRPAIRQEASPRTIHHRY